MILELFSNLNDSMSDKIPTDFTDVGSGHAVERLSAAMW